MVLRKMINIASTPLDKAISHLLIGALFFAMRSCEYLNTNTNEEKKRTKLLRLQNIKFKKEGKLVPFSSSILRSADLVIITFEFQKNMNRNQSVHMFKTNDKTLNPVSAWATTVQRILNTIPGANGNTKVCSFLSNQKVIELDAFLVRTKLRSVVELIGEVVLGFGKEDVGLHSIRSGGAMAMFLSGVSDVIIQRVGRWSSLAYLEYIREQVETFTFGVSQKMLEHEAFHHLNENIEKSNEEKPTKSDGSIQIPYTVHFSDGVLEKDTNNQSIVIKDNKVMEDDA
jgi:hypothetical protein